MGHREHDEWARQSKSSLIASEGVFSVCDHPAASGGAGGGITLS